MTRKVLDTVDIPPGFRDPVADSQKTFRNIMDAVAHPGRFVLLGNGLCCPEGFHKSTTAVCLALLDFDTPLWIDEAIASTRVCRWLGFHCGVPAATSPKTAAFAVLNAGEPMPGPDTFNPGTEERPDLSTTLIVQVAGLENRGGLMLQGPGINGEKYLDPVGLPRRFLKERNRLCKDFPRGVDILFTCDEKLAALPRTTIIKEP